ACASRSVSTAMNQSYGDVVSRVLSREAQLVLESVQGDGARVAARLRTPVVPEDERAPMIEGYHFAIFELDDCCRLRSFAIPRIEVADKRAHFGVQSCSPGPPSISVTWWWVMPYSMALSSRR